MTPWRPGAAVELFKNRFKREVDLITGPATDNAVGKDFIEGQIGVNALNARIESTTPWASSSRDSVRRA